MSKVLKFPAEDEVERVAQEKEVVSLVEELLNKLERFAMVESTDIREELEHFRHNVLFQVGRR